jgi:hypothetical protein
MKSLTSVTPATAFAGNDEPERKTIFRDFLILVPSFFYGISRPMQNRSVACHDEGF